MVRHFTTAVSLALLLGCTTTPVQPVSGEQTFLTHCAACHGADGRGGGPVAATLSVPVPDLRTLTRRYGEFPADRVASYIDGRNLPAAHGARSMPVWGGVFDTTDRLLRGAEGAEHRIEAVVAYLRERQEAPN